MGDARMGTQSQIVKRLALRNQWTVWQRPNDLDEETVDLHFSRNLFAAQVRKLHCGGANRSML